MSEKLVSNNMIKITERLLCYIDYYDDNGIKMSSESGAYEQRIKIIFDKCESERTEQYTSTENYGESEKTYYSSNEENDHYISEAIYDLYGDVVTKYLLDKINLKFTKLKLDIVGNSKIKINKEFLIKAISNFNYISIDIGSNTENVIYFPNGEFRFKSFEFNGGTVYLPELFDIRCTKNIIFTNCKINKREDKSKVVFISKAINIDNLVMFDKIDWRIDNTPTKDVNEYRNSYIDIRNIYLNLDKYNNEVFSKSKFSDPLFIITSSNNVSLYNTTVLEGSNFKIFEFKGCNSLNIVNFYRKTKSIKNYTIGIEGTNTTDISEFNLVCENESKDYAIVYSPKDSDFFKNISITDFRVSNCGFININGCILNSFRLSNGVLTKSLFIDSKNSNILEISISDCKIDLNKDYYLYGNTIDLRNSSLFHNNKSYYGNLSIEATTGIKIMNSNILCDNKDIEFKVLDECSLDISNSNISGNNLSIYKPVLENELAEAMEEAFRSSKRNVKISGSTISIFGDFKLYNEIDKFKIVDSKFLNANSISILKTFLSFENVTIDSEHKAIPIEIDSCKFGLFSLYTNEVPQNNTITIKNSSGNVEYVCNDITNEVDSSILNLNLESCRIGFISNSKNVPIKIKVNSNNSRSSCIYGYSNVKVVPDITSIDRNIFTSVDKYEVITDKVSYGNV